MVYNIWYIYIYIYIYSHLEVIDARILQNCNVNGNIIFYDLGGAQFLSPDLCPPILAQAAETTKMKRPQHQVDGQQVTTRFISG